MYYGILHFKRILFLFTLVILIMLLITKYISHTILPKTNEFIYII